MIETDLARSVSAAVLRREFDLAFAQPPHTENASLENMLAVRIGGDPYAIRLAEITGLYAGRRIVELRTSTPELLGMVGFRGQIAPVYDLAALLGYDTRRAPRWFVLVPWRETVALAFDAFEAQLTIPAERFVATAGEGGDTRAHVRGAVHADSIVRPLLHLPSAIQDIQERVANTHQTTPSAQER
jgi:chemotaxis signal transduction protein